MMTDPYFEATVDEIRGFDLGDDAELLTELESRRKGDSAGLDGEDWMLLGVLLHRRRESQQALACFLRAALGGHTVSQAHYLRAHLLLQAGEIAKAEEELRQVEATTARDRLVPTAALLHVRGLLSAAKRDTAGARSLLRRAVDAGEPAPARLLALARLELEAGEVDAAERDLREALELEPDSAEVMVELAAAVARRGDRSEAFSLLGRAVDLDERWRGRIRETPHFADLLRDPSLPASLAGKKAPNATWMDARTPWIAALRRQGSELRLDWLDRAGSDAIRDRLAKAYAASGPLGTLHTDATLERSRALIARYVPVARGPVTRARDGNEEPILLFVDPEAPSPRMLLALSEHYPPFLWVPVGGTVDDMALALRDVDARPRLGRLDMTRVVRGFVGYRGRLALANLLSGELEHADVADLDRHFTLSPFLELGSWGSAYDDDPWPDEIPNQPRWMLKMQARQERTNAQRPGRVWSVSRRTRHSRSYLTIELHQGDIIVGQVRYRPADSDEVIRRLNEHFGSDYPLDMPLDAVATLLGFAFDRGRDIQMRLDASSDPDEIAGLLQVSSALRHGDLGMIRVYRRYMDHPDPMVRATLCNIFLYYNFESLLEEMSVTEPDRELRQQIEIALDEGIPPPDDDPYRNDEAEPAIEDEVSV